MSRRPQVSVVMTVFNSGPWLAETIDSILGQTIQDLEFIIVDDGSTDGTDDVIRDYQSRDARIRPWFVSHRGSAAAANAGIAQARSEFIARIDHDDLALPHRLETQLAWMERTGVQGCGSWARAFGEKDAVWWYPETHDAIGRELLFRLSLIHSSVLVRADILRANPYREETILDDYELWTRLVPRYSFGNVPEVLTCYRCHSRQTHVVHGRRSREDFRRYRFRYFYQRFPGTPLPDYLALARVSDRLPMASLAELERAGEWLTELAKGPDLRLRQRMAERWQQTCTCSAALGSAVEDVRRRYENFLACNRP